MHATFSGTKRYDVIRRLGEGGMGIVYEVEDTKRGERVALKTLKNPDPDRIYRLKQEFRALAELSDPNLVALHELLVDGGTCFFTMELIKGTSFLKYVNASSGYPSRRPISSGLSISSNTMGSSGSSGSSVQANGLVSETPPPPEPPEPPEPGSWPCCDEQRLRGALPQLARGLIRLHQAGKVHRDIKPSNILVTNQGRLVLLDFGLVVQTDAIDDFSQEGHLVGTADYMAPEQTLGQRPTAATDWYAVGVLLYEALTGCLPFQGTPVQILLEKQKNVPRPPRALIPDVPRDLDELCVDLLLRDPEARPKADDVLRRLGAGTPMRRVVAGTGSQAPFAGRQAELDQLASCLKAVANNRAQAILVAGPSGIGKSALIRRFLGSERAASRDLVILYGRCYDRETVAFQALDGLIDNLSRFWRQLSPLHAAELVPRNAALLPRLFPVLGRVPVIADAPTGQTAVDPNEMRTRAFAALRETLQRLAERRPLVLFLDDMQWADANTLFLLSDFMRPPDPPCLFLILATRPENLARLNELLSTMDADTQVLKLEALPQADATELARQLLDADAVNLGARVADEAEGNPFFISELAQYVRTMASAELSPSSLSSIRLDDVLSQRIQALPEPTRRLLDVVALAGAPVTRNTLRTAVGLPRRELERELATLDKLKLIRSSGRRGYDRREPFHDRIRDVTVACMAESTRRAHHRALALSLLGRAKDEQLAYHWRGAGDHQRAAEHGQAAAEKALTRLDFDRAANLFQLTLDLGAFEPAQRRHLLTALAQALANAGRPAAAAEAFKKACDDADAVTRLDLQRRSAEELLRGGYFDQGLREVQAVLTAVGMRLARTPGQALLMIFVRRAWLRLRGLRWREVAAGDLAPRVLTRIDISWSVAAFVGIVDPIRGAEFQSRHLLLALRAGQRKRVGRALAAEVAFLAALGSRRARRVSEITRRFTATSDNPYLQALVPFSEAFVSYFLENDWSACLEQFRQAGERFKTHQAGGWELDTVLLWTCFCRIYLGQLSELGQLIPAQIRAAERRGDRYMVVSLRTRTYLIWLVRDDIEGARREVELAMDSWTDPCDSYQSPHFWALCADCDIALYEGRAEAAAARMEEDQEHIRSAHMLRVDIALVEMCFVKARIALARATLALADDPQSHHQVRSRAREVRRLMRRIARTGLPLARAMVPMLAAGLASLASRDAEVVDHLRQAAAALDGLETMLLANAVKFRLGELLSGEEGAPLARESATWMAEQGVKNPAKITAMLVPLFRSC